MYSNRTFPQTICLKMVKLIMIYNVSLNMTKIIYAGHVQTVGNLKPKLITHPGSGFLVLTLWSRSCVLVARSVGLGLPVIITNCDQKFLQSMTVITNWQSVTSIIKYDRKLLWSVAYIAKCDKKLLQCDNYYKKRYNKWQPFCYINRLF